MRLLDRFQLRELATPLALCLGGFLVFWIGFDLLAELPEYQRQRLTVTEVCHLYVIRMPELLNTVLPVALLLGLLYALTQHARHHELTAMRAAGQSLWRLSVPYFLVGLLCSTVLYLLNEHVFPDGPDRAERLRQRHSTNQTQNVWLPRLTFRNQGDDRHWNIASLHRLAGELRGPSFREPLGAGAHRVVRAESARWVNQQWRFEGVRESVFRSAEDRAPAVVAPPTWVFIPEFKETPESLLSRGGVRIPDTNTIWQVGITNSVVGWSINRHSISNVVLEGFELRASLAASAHRQVQAASGIWTNGMWLFGGVREFVFRHGADAEPVETVSSIREFPELSESPEQLRSEVKITGRNLHKVMRRPQLSVAEVRAYQELHPHLNGRDAAYLNTQLHGRLAAPWTCLVVVAIAIPFGAPGGRRNVFYGVAGSLALAFVYFVLQRLGFALGQSGSVPAWIGAWLPNIAFAVTGLLLMWKVR